MTTFDSPTIKRLAADLAHNILAVWPRLGYDVPPELATADQLAAVLQPGVAAFIGRLLTLVPGQAGLLPEIAGRYFASPATAEGLWRFLYDPQATSYEMASLLVGVGLAPSAALFTYFDQPLALLVAAANAAIAATTQTVESVPARPLAPLPDSLQIDEFVIEDVQGFVDALAAQGLDRIETGQAIAADGVTVLFTWEPVLMSAASPPPPSPVTAGPEESLGETAGEFPLGEGSSGGDPETTSAEPPSAAPDSVDLRLDAALPERVVVGRVFDLAIAVKRPDSQPLAPDDLTRRESADFAAIWPDEAAFIQLRVQISAPECDIHGGDSRQFRLLAGQDGPAIYFQLTPRRPGGLSIIITVYQEMDWIGSTRLRTEAGAGETRGELAITVNSQPLGGPEVNDVALWKAIGDGYNLDELKELCFELGIDYDALAGDSKPAKARELVQHARRHGISAQLVALIMAERPHLLAPA